MKGESKLFNLIIYVAIKLRKISESIVNTSNCFKSINFDLKEILHDIV